VLCKLIPTVENVNRIADELIAPMRGGGPKLSIAS
jgi:hypothetical protein